MDEPGPAGEPPESPPSAPSRRPLSQIVGIALLALLLFSAASVAVGAVALVNVHDDGARVEYVIDPAAYQAQLLDTAMVDQETGVRGYALSGQRDFLKPYASGLAIQQRAVSSLRRLSGGLPAATGTDLSRVIGQASYWRAHYAEPTISQVSRTGRPVISPDVITGKADFDALRARIAVLQTDVSAVKDQALAALNDSSTVVDAVFIAVTAGLTVIVVVLAVGVRATVIRPLDRLAGQTRRVAGGDFGHEVTVAGPREVTDLAAAVNTMRERILHELSATRTANAGLVARADELQRSNAELEQFAYIASHDLQEPLRKVASFTQLLQRRYGGQLDARADQYIEFASDGARRMQALINDLLAYSRVGRSAREPALVSSETALAQARANLATAIEETGATIEAGHLPLVLAEPPLLTAVFQNLLSNALKFSGGKPPRVVITVSRQEPFWLFSFSDNGIGIDPEYADRIFAIFQRLHERSAYPGTGIGLAMTRKIIEYFGGQIWLDPSFTGGARFFFTLPMPAETLDSPQPPIARPTADPDDKETDD